MQSSRQSQRSLKKKRENAGREATAETLDVPTTTLEPGSPQSAEYQFTVQPPRTPDPRDHTDDDKEPGPPTKIQEKVEAQAADKKNDQPEREEADRAGPAHQLLQNRLFRRNKPISRSLRIKRNSTSSKVSVASFRSQQRPEPPRTGEPAPSRPKSWDLPRDMDNIDAWRAGVSESFAKDSFVAIDPYEKHRPKRGKAASVYSSKRKSQVEAAAWSTPVAYGPVKPAGFQGGYRGAVEGDRAAGTESFSNRRISIIGSSSTRSSQSYYSLTPDGAVEDDITPPKDGLEVPPSTHPPHSNHIPYPYPGHITIEKPLAHTYHQHVVIQHVEPVSEDDGLPAPNTSVSTENQSFTGFVYDWWKYVSRKAYLYILLGLPALYFTRVANIFDDANIELIVMKRMVLDRASTRRMGDFYQDPATSPPGYQKLKRSWQHFIDTLIKEWKTLNIISVLLLSAILSLLQIDSANDDPLVHYAALYSLICALVSLVLGCMYIVRFNTMRKPHKAIAWAEETQKELQEVGILWNVWILLALPGVWLIWSLIFYVMCIIVYVWRGDPDNPPPPFSPNVTLAARCILSGALGLAVVYGGIVVRTFIYFGAPMDRRFRERVREWMQQKEDEIKKRILKSNELANQSTWSAHIKDGARFNDSSPPLSRQGYVVSTDDSIRSSRSQAFRDSVQPIIRRPLIHVEDPPREVRFHGLPSASTMSFHPPSGGSPGPFPQPSTPVEIPSDTFQEPDQRLRPVPSQVLSDSPRPDVERHLEPPSSKSLPEFPQTDSPTHLDPGLNLAFPTLTSKLSMLDLAQSPHSNSNLEKPHRATHRRFHTYTSSGGNALLDRLAAAPVITAPSASLDSFIHISHDDPVYSRFFHRSPHPIRHDGRLYPTAAHLFEAMKYLKLNPELAEQIRLCSDVDAVYRLSEHCSHYCRPDWNEVADWKLEKLLYLKFTQYPDLRDLLLSTHPRPIFCTDYEEVVRSVYRPDSPVSGPVHNAFGTALVRVRDRLRQQGRTL
ncbi:GTP cyclohydrolase II [Coprinopsis cinerea AmutBmut pab1-1]|nr:GTP cyclohydrolase II [Coprinopsis cinerea AmutBmut pab1-1]